MIIVKKIFIALSVTFNILLSQIPIAVIDFSAEGISNSEARTLTDRFRYELFRSKEYRVIEREAIDEILKEQGLQQSGCMSTECIVEIGSLIGVDKVIGGSIGLVGTIYTISVRLINIETGEIENFVTYDYDEEIGKLLTSGMADAVELLLSDINSVPIDKTKDRKKISEYIQSIFSKKNEIQDVTTDITTPIQKPTPISIGTSLGIPALKPYEGIIGDSNLLSENTSQDDKKIYRVIAVKIPYRTGPSTDSTIFKYLYNSDKIILIDTVDNWSKVEFYGYIGYVGSIFIEPSPDTNFELIYGWKAYPGYTGQEFDCIKVLHRFPVRIDNFLKLNLDIDLDAILQLYDENRDNPIYSVFIESQGTYYIRNIPEGKYFLKMYFGKDLMIKSYKKQCILKFMTQPLYDFTEVVFDFNLIAAGVENIGVFITSKYLVRSYSYNITAGKNSLVLTEN